MGLGGKVALITGAGSGIGHRTALLFASEGASVAAVDIDPVSVFETVAEIEGAGGQGLAVFADVSRDADCRAMVEATERAFGGLHVLFNNAGVSHAQDSDAVQTTEEIWDFTFSVNVKGVFLGCKHGIPALRRSGGGSIINTASFVAKVGAATSQLAYTS